MHTDIKSASGQLSEARYAHGFFLIVISLVGAAYKLSEVVQGVGLEQLSYPDERNYYLPGAQYLLQQGLSFFMGERSLWNGPVNTVWIALWAADVALVKIANIALVSFAGIALWDLIRRATSLKLAYLGLIVFSFHPGLLEFGGTLLTEPVYISLLVFSFWAVALPGKRSWFIGGLLFGIATLARPTTQLFPFALLGLALLPVISGEVKKKLCVFAVGALLLVIPWGVKNSIYLNKVGLANGSGAVLYLGNDLRKNGDEPLYSEMGFDTFEITAPYTHLDTPGDKALTRASFDFITQYPSDIALLTLVKAGRYMFGYPNAYFYPYRNAVENYRKDGLLSVCAKVSLILLTAILMLFSLSFFVRPFREHDAQGILCVTIISYFIGLHALTFPIPRLALPILPFLLFCTACTLHYRSRYLLQIIAVLTVVSFISLSRYNEELGVVSADEKRYFSTLVDIRTAEVDPIESYGIKRVSKNEFIGNKFDPYIVYSIEPTEAKRNQVVFVELQATPAKLRKRTKLRANIYWGDASGIQAENTKSFFVYVDGKKRTYMISPSLLPSWQGTITQLRLDFPDKRRNVTYRVEGIQLAK